MPVRTHMTRTTVDRAMPPRNATSARRETKNSTRGRRIESARRRSPNRRDLA